MLRTIANQYEEAFRTRDWRMVQGGSLSMFARQHRVTLASGLLSKGGTGE